MKKKSSSKPKPTAGELAILNVLWGLESATVREIHAECERQQPVGYTTVLKLLQIMTDKGLVTRDESERAHVYRPALKREETQGQMVSDLLDRVFGGSAGQLVLRALSERKASKAEIEEIRCMLDNIEKGGKQGEKP
ncbi:MAG: BlaI/MecI/CopY family transcriptional regulator [Bryobacteraceae bacterium]|nr:BlaI/MecI/CopY family transcriptional regulator [Bryobacteraceae bacterium]